MKYWIGVAIIAITSSFCGIHFFDEAGKLDIGNTVFLSMIMLGWFYHCEKGRS